MIGIFLPPVMPVCFLPVLLRRDISGIRLPECNFSRNTKDRAIGDIKRTVKPIARMLHVLNVVRRRIVGECA